MRGVMLDADDAPVRGAREYAGCIIRVGVRRDNFGSRFIHSLQVPDDPMKGGDRGRGFQVADMLADKNLPPNRKRHRVLQMSADAQDRR